MRNKLFFFLLLLIALTNTVKSQQYVLEQLTGNPVNTNGWTLVGSAAVNGDNILITSTSGGVGAIYVANPINLNICTGWTAEFDYRMFDGSGADGIAMWFLQTPPTGFGGGGSVGMPANPNGVAVLLDQYDNGCGDNSIQIFCGNGTVPYAECSPNVVARVTNVTEIRQSNYNRCRITYNNGNIQVFINGVLRLSGFCLANFNGYLGFSSSTGGSTDNHSIKNVTIYTSAPVSNAGSDQNICSGRTIQLGQTPNPNYTYQWTPATNLSNNTVANPTFSFTNNTGVTQNFTYIVRTDTGSAGCFSRDTIIITVQPNVTHPNGCNLNAIRDAVAAACPNCIELSGCNPQCSMYFYNPNSQTGSQAQAFAEQFGGNLASIQNAAENQLIIDALNTRSLGGIIWIGFNDEAQEGTFVWYDQSPITYTNWAPGEPNNSGDEDCTQLYPNGQWNDLSCTSGNSASVFEISLCPQPTITNADLICNGNTTNLVANTILGSQPYNYVWSVPGLSNSIPVSPTINSSYSTTVSDRYQCTATTTTTVNVYNVNISAGPDQNIVLVTARNLMVQALQDLIGFLQQI